VDRDHGDVHPLYERMGQPRYPTQQQIKALQQAAEMPPPGVMDLNGNDLTLDIAANGLAIIQLK
jgi:beta-xylosidase